MTGLFRTMIGKNVKAYFILLPLAFVRRDLGELQTLSQVSRSVTRNSNPVTSEYKTGELTTTPLGFTTCFSKVQACSGRCILNHLSGGPLRVGDVAEFRTNPQNSGNFDTASISMHHGSINVVWYGAPYRSVQNSSFIDLSGTSHISMLSKFYDCVIERDAFCVRQLRGRNSVTMNTVIILNQSRDSAVISVRLQAAFSTGEGFFSSSQCSD
jgi:hypothetical protein